MAKDKRITLHIEESKKDIIKLKAQKLNLSISDFLCIVASKISVEDFKKKVIDKNIEKDKKEKKGWLTFRSSEQDLQNLENKAKEIGISLTDYLISVGLKLDLEVIFKEKK